MTKKADIDLLIFDLDGTLIESKWDIADSVNLTLRDLGVPERSQEEIFGFVGDGVKKLLRSAVGEGNKDIYDEALRIFRGHYLAHCLDRTTFYPGIDRVLTHFSNKQKAVATNKAIEYTNVILNGLARALCLCRRRRQWVRPKARARHVGACDGATRSRRRIARCWSATARTTSTAVTTPAFVCAQWGTAWAIVRRWRLASRIGSLNDRKN